MKKNVRKKILNECKKFKKKGINYKLIKKLLKNNTFDIKKREFDKEEGVYSKDRELTIRDNGYTIEMSYDNGFSMEIIFDKDFKKRSIKESTVVLDITENILELEIELLRGEETIDLSHKIGFEKKEILNLNKSSLKYTIKKRTITITIDSLPF